MTLIKFFKVTLFAICLVLLVFLCGCTNEYTKTVKNQNKIHLTMTLDKQANKLLGGMVHEYQNKSQQTENILVYALFPNSFKENAEHPALNPDNIQKAYPNGQSFGEMDIKTVKVNQTSVEIKYVSADNYYLEVPINLPSQQKVEIEIIFEVKLAEVIHRLGYYDSNYNLGSFYPMPLEKSNNEYNLAPFTATGDCFYNQINNISVTALIPSEMSLSTTGKIIESSSQDNLTKYEIDAPLSRDFLLVVNNNKTITSIVDDTLITYSYHKDDQPQETMQLISSAFSFFSKKLCDYPFPTLTVTQSNLIENGVEYPCHILISNNLSKDDYNHTIVHEVAHQWFYNLVYSNQIKNPFLDEGLAEYFTLLFIKDNSSYGDFNKLIAEYREDYRVFLEVIKNYNTDFDDNINRDIHSFDNNMSYVYLNYIKATIMYDDLLNTIGESNFLKGIRNYINSNIYSIATPTDLINCMQKSTKIQLDKWFVNYFTT